jgi:hypothetical protein
VDKINSISVEEGNRGKYNQFITPHQKNPDSLYFLHTTQDIYISNLISNVMFLLVAKAVEGLLFCLKTKFHVLRKQYFWVRRNSRLWTLLTMAIEGNLMVLTFNCCLQLLVPMSFNFFDKLNIVICVLFLFAACVYSIAFYQMIYAVEKKGAAETILKYSEYSVRSYYLESNCFLLRTFVRGVLQALTFQSYFIQIVCLATSDVIFSALTIAFRNQFCYRVVFISVFMYNFLFFLLDGLFLFHYKYVELINENTFNLIVYVVLWGLAGTYALIFLSLSFIGVYEACSQNS